MGKVIDYTVIDEDQPHRLADKVRALILEGWQPLGSVSCSLSEADDYKFTMFAQALVKYAPEDDEVMNQALDLWERFSPYAASEVGNGIYCVFCNEWEEKHMDDCVYLMATVLVAAAQGAT